MVCSSWLKLVGFVVLYIMSMLSAEVKAEVDRILGSEYGDLAKWKAMCGYLLKQKIFYYSTIKVDELLVHDQNRGGSGISVHNAHSKGAIILKAGCDPTMLHSSTCFEISPIHPREQLKLLVLRSYGKLTRICLPNPMGEKGTSQCHQAISPNFAKL